MNGMTYFILRADRWLHVRLGYMVKQIPDKHKGYLSDFGHRLGLCYEDEANEYIRMVRKYTMLPYVRLVTLYQQAVYCEKKGIPGSFIECGVWKGGATAVMAFANLRHGQKRRDIHLFDAFDDINEPDATIDGERALRDVRDLAGKAAGTSGRLQPIKGVYDRLGGHGTIEDNRHVLEHVAGYESAFLHFHKGWFQETVPLTAGSVGPIAILRLDGDWYASIKVCLESLYGNVVSGGFVVVDDYGVYDGCTRAVNEFLDMNGINVFLHQVDGGCAYLIKP
jgi:hypothetical protein